MVCTRAISKPLTYYKANAVSTHEDRLDHVGISDGPPQQAKLTRPPLARPSNKMFPSTVMLSASNEISGNSRDSELLQFDNSFNISPMSLSIYYICMLIFSMCLSWLLPCVIPQMNLQSPMTPMIPWNKQMTKHSKSRKIKKALWLISNTSYHYLLFCYFHIFSC